jgi:hypothetical protein
MAVCELVEKCIFFQGKMSRTPAALEMFKVKYCKGSFESCARFHVFKAIGIEKVPVTLFPNQSEKATVIIEYAP